MPLRRALLGLLFPITVFATTLLATTAHAADRLRIAAVPSMAPAAVTLNAAFAKAHPGSAIELVGGTSADLGAAIEKGDAIDLLLADDEALPKRLASSGLADGATLTRLGLGRLALWTNTPGINPGRGRSVFAAQYVNQIAMADAATSPYGQIALSALDGLGVSEGAKPKLKAYPDDVAAAKAVQDKAADIGLVPFALMKAPGFDGVGIYILLPGGTYEPARHTAIVTRSGNANAAAKAYLAFLASPEARAILAAAGFDAPDAATY